VGHPNLIERRISRFMREPLSVRNAVSVIVVATTIVIVVSATLMRVLDSSEYPNIGRGLWWAMQTVPTVGYGDVTPAHTSGRIVASVVMLWGIAFVAILTAAITTTFVTRATREREQAEAEEDVGVEKRLDDLAARLDRIEKLLVPRAGGG
jgi:voltage-gated potassium channel